MAERESAQEAVARRMTAMGIQVEPVSGGRTAVCRMRLQRTVFETTGPSLRIESVTFATVGRDRLKCLAPRALFQLPIVRILDCRDATAIEARIHLAWQRHVAHLEDVEGWLRQIGATFETEEGHSVVSVALRGEPEDTRGRMIDPHRMILPSRGPLSGVALRRADDRVFPVDFRVSSSVDLERSVSNRLEELVQLDSRLAQESRLEALHDEPRVAPRPAGERRPIVLAAGPRVIQERSCIESLRLRGYQVETASSERDAITTFDQCSPELVLADVGLGRSEGIDLIQSLRHVPGIEEVPVILIDSHKREERREAARRMGAAGYLVYPIDVSRIAERLTRIVENPRRRRFTRYPQRLPVHIGGTGQPLLTDSIGRGGMFLATEADLPESAIQDCRLALPEIGADLRVEAEVIYRARSGRQARAGVGVRFNAFPDADEPVLIEYLRNLHPAPPVAMF